MVSEKSDEKQDQTFKQRTFQSAGYLLDLNETQLIDSLFKRQSSRISWVKNYIKNSQTHKSVQRLSNTQSISWGSFF